MVDKKDIIYTVDILCATLKLLVETPKQPFISPYDFDYIWPFIKILGYQGSLDRIPNDLLTNAIKDTQAYKDYVDVYEGVEVPTIQPELVESTQGTHRTPKATRTPNPVVVQKKKGKQIAGESSLPKRSLKIRIRQKKSTPTTPLPPIEKKILEEDVEKLVEGEDESNSDEFVNIVLLSDEDFSDRIELESHKEKSKEIVDDEEKKDNDDKHDDAKDDDDDNDNDDHDHDDQPLIRTRRLDLSSNKAIIKELMVSDTHMPDARSQDPSRLTSSRHANLIGIGQMEEMCEALRVKVPQLIVSTTSDLMKEALPRLVTDVVNKERESTRATIPALISQEFAAYTSKIIEELFGIHMQNMNLPKAMYEKSSVSTDSCKYDAFNKRDHDDQPSDDAPLKGEKSAKRQNTSRIYKSARGSSSRKPAKESNTSEDLKRLQPEALLFYGLQKNPNEPPRYLYNKDLFFLKNKNTKEKKYVLSLYKIHATSFPEEDLEEKMIRWVGLIYLNNKDEKRIIDLVDISKFCDATMEKVLKEVKLKIFEIEFKTKTLLLGELDLKIMKAYEREIMNCLKNHKQMRRWESFSLPEKLDLAESNYSTWSYFFKGHCSNFGVLKHIEEPVTEASTSTPPTDEWITADSIVKSWIFLTLSSTLRKRLIKANPKMAKAAWDAIETIFQDNKRTRTISLKGELRVIQIGDQTADEYFSKIEAIITLLTDLGSDIPILRPKAPTRLHGNNRPNSPQPTDTGSSHRGLAVQGLTLANGQATALLRLKRFIHELLGSNGHVSLFLLWRDVEESISVVDLYMGLKLKPPRAWSAVDVLGIFGSSVVLFDTQDVEHPLFFITAWSRDRLLSYLSVLAHAALVSLGECSVVTGYGKILIWCGMVGRIAIRIDVLVVDVVHWSSVLVTLTRSVSYAVHAGLSSTMHDPREPHFFCSLEAGFLIGLGANYTVVYSGFVSFLGNISTLSWSSKRLKLPFSRSSAEVSIGVAYAVAGNMLVTHSFYESFQLNQALSTLLLFVLWIKGNDAGVISSMSRANNVMAHERA
ncbi:hypothetical protein Tco_1203264 [Tanacetum coccineum]